MIKYFTTCLTFLFVFGSNINTRAIASPATNSDALFFNLTSATVPTVITSAATNITSTSAQVNGSINPEGVSTTYFFEFGTTASYGLSTGSISAGSGSAVVQVNVTLSALLPNTLYHYRLVATNSSGTSTGEDVTFTTLPVKMNAISPVQNAVNVAQTSSIRFTFNSIMTVSSLNDSSVNITGSISGKHTGTFTFSAGNTVATFTPAIPFSRGEVVSVSVTTKVKGPSTASTQPFYSEFTIATVNGDGNFVYQNNYSVGNSPSSIHFGDYDNDGDADFSVANTNSNDLYLYTNDGVGNFSFNDVTISAVNPVAHIQADIDNNGGFDFIVANGSASSLSIIKSSGTGGYAVPVTVSVGNTPSSLSAADFDGDGDVDIALIDENNTRLTTLINNSGTGAFVQSASQFSNSNLRGIAHGDFDADGDIDIAVTLQDSNTVVLLKNNGTGYERFSTTTVLNGPGAIISANVDTDSDLDLVVGTDSNVYVLKNNGSGTFTATPFSSNGGGYSLATGLINGDASVDLVVGNYSSGLITILKNNGSGSFSVLSSASTSSSSLRDIAVADIDNDGDLDIAGTRSDFSDVNLLRNNPPPPTPQKLYALAGNEEVTLVWNRGGQIAEEKTSTDTDFLKYNIYYGGEPSPTDLKISTSPGDQNDTSITITGLSNETMYYFRVTAVDSGGNESGYSNEDVAVPVIEQGNAISLDGDNSYINVNASTGNFGSGDFTVEFWMNSGGTEGNNYIMGKRAVCDFDFLWNIYTNNSSVMVLEMINPQQGLTQSITGNTIVNDSKWHHIAVTRRDSVLSIYVDGVEDISTTEINILDINTDATLQIGKSACGNYYGLLDEVSIWNTARTPEEVMEDGVRPLRGDEDGLLALYHFDEDISETAYDATPNANDGLFLGGVTIVPSDAMTPSAPTGLVSSISNNRVTLSWNQNPESDVVEYNIYRDFQPSATTWVAAVNGSTLRYVDNDVSNYTTYAYRITAVDGGENESDYSGDVMATPEPVTGSISGMKFHDANSNHLYDDDEVGISGWKIFVTDGELFDSTVTDSSGYYIFSELYPSTYTVSEKNNGGWVQTYPASKTYSVSIIGGLDTTGFYFGNTRTGVIVVTPPPDTTIYWNDSLIWGGGSLPGENDTIRLPNNVRIILNLDSLPNNRNTIGSLWIPDSSVLIIVGGGTFNILGNFLIEGNFEFDSTSDAVIILDGNFEVGGNFEPGNSTIQLNGNRRIIIGRNIGGGGKVHGNNVPLDAGGRVYFNNLVVNGDSTFTNGTLVVQGVLTLNANLTIGLDAPEKTNSNQMLAASTDTLLINNTDTAAIAGNGNINNGTLRRRLQQGQTGKYRFHSVNTAVNFANDGTYPSSLTMIKFPTESRVDTTLYLAFKGGTVDTVNNFVRTTNIKTYSKWVFGQVGHKLGDSTGGPIYDITTEDAGIEKSANGVPVSTPTATVSLNYNPLLLKGIPEPQLGILKTATALKVNVLHDSDGNPNTTTDRVAKQWNVRVYRGSVAPANLATSANTISLFADDLGEGTMIANIADTVNWNVIQRFVNTVSTNDTAHSVSRLMAEGDFDSVTFVVTPDVGKFRTLKVETALSAKSIKMKAKKGLPLPLVPIANVRDTIVAKNSGLVVGRAQTTNKDSAKVYAWLTWGKGKDLAKFFTFEHTGPSYPADSLRVDGKKTKKLSKGLKADSKKYKNSLAAELAVLKLNVIGSTKGTLPPNFADLEVNMPSSPFHEMKIGEMVTRLDSAMTY
ncbi:MAG: VCBS repeat-containing protein, partial [Ignavibacteriales bacterium]|nr:VCBS repeat-containing protein [Ignavibacteriales bacterium]